MENKLSEGWTLKKMLDVVDYEGGSQPPKKYFIYQPKKGYVRLLQIRDFGKNPFPTYVPNSKRLKKVSEDDILIARYGGSTSEKDSLGRVCTGLSGAYNVALAKLIFSDKELDRRYVKYLFMGPWFRDVVSKNSRSCQKGFNREELNGIVFPIAPLEEQKRISDKLDVLLTKVKNTQSRLAKIPTILGRFRQSVLASAFSRELTKAWRKKNKVDVEWQEIPLGDVLTDLKYGTAKKCFREKKKHPVLRIPNVVQGYIDLNDLKYTDLDKKEYESLKLETGDILLVRSNGSVSLVGRTALVTDREKGMAYAGYLIRLRVNKDLIIPEFLQYQFQSYAMRLQIELPARSTSGVNNINSEEVKNLQIALPSLDEQREVVRRLKATFMFLEKNEQEFNKAKSYVDKLEQSILAKAFRGELVR